MIEAACSAAATVKSSTTSFETMTPSVARWTYLTRPAPRSTLVRSSANLMADARNEAAPASAMCRSILRCPGAWFARCMKTLVSSR